MKILLTGATGFIGKFVYTLSNDIKPVYRVGNVIEADDFVLVDSITGTTDWTGCFDNVHCIIHLAGLAHSLSHSQNEIQSVNLYGTLNLAKQAVKAGVKRFVFVSTTLVNGSSTSTSSFSHKSVANPCNANAEAKYEAEKELKKIATETGLEIVIVIPTLVYGPNAPGNFGALTRLVDKVPLLPFGFTDNKRDFIAVQNLADLLITCANNPGAAGHTFLASDGETVSIKDFTNEIAKGLDKKLVQLPVPSSLMYLVARLIGKHAMAEHLLGNLQVDSSNAQEVLGWVPPYTMEQAMASLSENKK